MKNHIRINGRLLQTNKRFSQLKQQQKEWIAGVFKNRYCSKMKELNFKNKLPRDVRDEVIQQVYVEVETRGIWIPFRELEKYCFNRTDKVVSGYNSNNTK